MTKFLFIYHQMTYPQSKEQMQEIMEQWQKWFNDNPFLDQGEMVGMSKLVMANGEVIDNGGANPTCGYSIVECANIDQAIAIAKKCPFLGQKDHIEVSPIMEKG